MAKEVSVEQALAQAFTASSSLLIENAGPFDLKGMPEAITKHVKSIKIIFDEGTVVFRFPPNTLISASHNPFQSILTEAFCL